MLHTSELNSEYYISVVRIPYVCLDFNLTQLHAACGKQVTFLFSRRFSSTSSAGKRGEQRHFGKVAGAGMFCCTKAASREDKLASVFRVNRDQQEARLDTC